MKGPAAEGERWLMLLLSSSMSEWREANTTASPRFLSEEKIPFGLASEERFGL